MKRKTALITGGSKGIGRQIALTFAEEGYNIIVNYYHNAVAAKEVCEIAEGNNVKAIAIYADIGKIDDIRQLYDKALKEFDTIDVVVNNAGMSDEVYFLDATEKMFDRLTAVDWKGLFFSSQIAAKIMIETKIQGVIINITSNQVDGCWPRAAIYAPTKAAVSKFTKNAAMELAPYGLRVVAIAPGYTDVGWEKGDIRLEAASRLPLNRFAKPQEIADAVIYMASDKAAYITGTTLTIDGGATLPVVAENDFMEVK